MHKILYKMYINVNINVMSVIVKEYYHAFRPNSVTLLISTYSLSMYMYIHVSRTHCRLATNTAHNHPILPTVGDWIPAHCTSDRLCWTPSNIYMLATEVLSKTEGGGELKYSTHTRSCAASGSSAGRVLCVQCSVLWVRIQPEAANLSLEK